MYTFGLSHVKQWTEYTIPNDNTTILVGISIIMASDFYVIIKYCTVSGKSSSTKCKQDLQLRSQIQGLNSTCLFLDLHNILPSTIWPAFFRGLACSHTMLYNCIKSQLVNKNNSKMHTAYMNYNATVGSDKNPRSLC